MAEAFHAIISLLQRQELSFSFDLFVEFLTRDCCFHFCHHYDNLPFPMVPMVEDFFLDSLCLSNTLNSQSAVS